MGYTNYSTNFYGKSILSNHIEDFRKRQIVTRLNEQAEQLEKDLRSYARPISIEVIISHSFKNRVRSFISNIKDKIIIYKTKKKLGLSFYIKEK